MEKTQNVGTKSAFTPIFIFLVEEGIIFKKKLGAILLMELENFLLSGSKQEQNFLIFQVRNILRFKTKLIHKK